MTTNKNELKFKKKGVPQTKNVDKIMKKCIVKLINGISKKNGKEYYRIDIIFDLGNAREYRKSVFLDYKDVLLLDVKPEDCEHV